MKLTSTKYDARNSLYSLITIMILSTLFVSSVTIGILYALSFNEYKGRLLELATSQANLIEASANYQFTYENKSRDEIESTMLLMLNDAYNHYYGFQDTGEFLYAKKEKNQIKFLFSLSRLDQKLIIPKDPRLESPMVMALNGQSGVLIGIDTDGKRVLAAYEFVDILNIGIVTKIDTSEINRPFISAIIIVLLVLSLSVMFSGYLLQRVRINILNTLNFESKNLLKANKKLKYEILEHKETEEKLDISRKKLAQIIKMSPLPMLVASSDNVIEIYNYKFSELFGYTINEFKDGAILWKSIFPNNKYSKEAYLGWLKASTLSLKEQEELHSKTWFLTTLHGKKIECEVYTVMTEDTTFVVINDVTIQKELQRDLVESKERAEELSQVKSDFLSTISHEIRTPINGVLGMTELILGTEVDEEQYKYAKAIKISGKILLELINDLLDSSKIEAKMLRLESIDFNLRSLLEDFIDIQSYKTREQHISLNWEIDCKCPIFLNGDPGRIRQILLNLVGNAFKFTKEGEISIEINKVWDDDNNILLQFIIKDSGIGIPKDSIGNIFDKFTQADVSTSRNYGGTGLGLSISKELVETMGGRLSVESQEGVGSEFTFTINLKKQTKVVSKNNKKKLLENSSDSINVLLYCDTNNKTKYLSNLMKYWNVNTHIVKDENAAIKFLKDSRSEANPTNIIIADIDGNKWEHLNVVVKNDSAISNTEIVIISSFGGRGDVKWLCDLGFSAYLSKPLKKADLHDVLLSIRNFKGEKHPIITKHTIRDILWDNKVILVADDNKINQKVATGILEKNGFIVDVVNDGIEALESLSVRRYNLVLMDCNMPKQDGFVTSKIIRSLDSKVLNHEIPIIAMTANITESDRQKCFDHGMNEFIPKPIEPENLIDIINRTIT